VNIECIVDFSESRAGKNQPQKRPRKIQVMKYHRYKGKRKK